MHVIENTKNNELGFRTNRQDELLQKTMLKNLATVAKCFDLLISACLDDPNCFLYQNKVTSDTKMLVEAMTYHEPSDLETHTQSSEAALSKIMYAIAIGSKALTSNYTIIQVTKVLWFAGYYRCAMRKRLNQSQYTMAMLDHRLIERAFSYRKYAGKFFKGEKVVQNTDIYIPICFDDEITRETLDCTNTPHMYTEDLDMDFETNLRNYSPEEFIRVKVVSGFNIFWLANKNTHEIQDVDAIIIDVHGGGFISGSSKVQIKWAPKYSNATGFPVFCIDYRLAPDYQFPAALNDCWQVYLWLRRYAEKYLALRFKKIIIEGESAGGNLALGIWNLCIQRGVQKPDGMTLIYPAMTCSLDAFSPSILTSIDDLCLNATYLFMVQHYYIGPHSEINRHFLCSPFYTPPKILAQYPPWRFIISGLDPLRDDCLRFIVNLLKNKIDVKVMEYRYCHHGFINHMKTPFNLKEPLDLLDKIIDYIMELTYLDS